MIELTDSAISAVRTALERSGTPDAGLRVMVQAGGCAGFKYMLGIVEQPDPNDLVLEKDGVRIFVEPSSEPHLKGTRVDFVVALEGSGFAFDNPNAASKCSCGKSFG
ncbi:iron-sulfur cluster assembly accessory protein [Roseomonas sp. NAR14]|uniref:Iron-sulfur cluster assembly accessory protein n=1 Tax=Roseomonas acroporae TaxID=2937791 RepID=A0A9X2BTU3_9PROT|nr:iron-sulfur cluster assembly accessory protein [Roseomonas acroporae]MCK8784993.1 iron-sulfur cluster assembly accessory protein [Roseomonas acroporae]